MAIDAASASNKPVLVHAEVVSDDDAGLPAGADGMDYASWLATRPVRWEEGAVRAVLSLAAQPREHAPRIHVLRLTDSAATPLLTAANLAMEPARTPEGLSSPRVTVSSCPHYMIFDAESVVRGDTRLKVAPPLRDALNRRKLWGALIDGPISLLASDRTCNAYSLPPGDGTRLPPATSPLCLSGFAAATSPHLQLCCCCCSLLLLAAAARCCCCCRTLLLLHPDAAAPASQSLPDA